MTAEGDVRLPKSKKATRRTRYWGRLHPKLGYDKKQDKAKAVLTCTECGAGLCMSNVARLEKDHFHEQGVCRKYAARMPKIGAANTRDAESRGDGASTGPSDLGSPAGMENMRQPAPSAFYATPQQQQKFTTHMAWFFLNNNIGTLPWEGLLCGKGTRGPGGPKHDELA
eukprot:271715-Chlamydomonas_euryale.AAC.5